MPAMKWSSENGGAYGHTISNLETESMRLYQRHIKPSMPVEERDDRSQLYSIHSCLNDFAGHPGGGLGRL